MPDLAPGRDVVVAMDQGTSSTKAIAVDASGTVVGRGSVPIGIEHSSLKGLVEAAQLRGMRRCLVGSRLCTDDWARIVVPGSTSQTSVCRVRISRKLTADEIAASTVEAVRLAIDGLSERVAAMAISNQRESAVVWDLETKRPLGPMLGWQDRRTTDAATSLREHADRVRRITGLPIDPMFSALKYAWLLDQVDPDRSRARAGEIVCGTVDSWLVYHHTGDVRIEAGNASRTGLLDLATCDWSEELCELYGIPLGCLPRVAASDEPTSPVLGWGLRDVRITGVLGDSHASLYGHGARTPGAVKVTLGTGSSIMGLLPAAGRDAPLSHHPGSPAGLVTTLAWSAPEPAYAFEGNILATGATSPSRIPPAESTWCPPSRASAPPGGTIGPRR